MPHMLCAAAPPRLDRHGRGIKSLSHLAKPCSRSDLVIMASPPSPDILNQPILPPPPGKVPNFLNPPSTAKAVYVAAGICLPLILLFAVLRYFAKFKILKRKTWDDCGFSYSSVAFPFALEMILRNLNSYLCSRSCERYSAKRRYKVDILV